MLVSPPCVIENAPVVLPVIRQRSMLQGKLWDVMTLPDILRNVHRLMYQLCASIWLPAVPLPTTPEMDSSFTDGVRFLEISMY